MKIIALLLLLACPAGAAEITGGDWHGADLVPANYDILRGTFTNVGKFNIASGNTVLVASGERLAVYAATVTIAGHLNASGSGLPGGAAGGSGLPGSDGFSPVLNGAGKGGSSPYGGGGGGHGAAGGRGAPAGFGGLGGIEYDLNANIGVPLSAADAFLGSGGGGGGGGNAADQSGGGGGGGGAVYIEAGYVVITGTVSANGQVGGVGVTSAGLPLSSGGGGGAGGAVAIKSAGGLNLINASLSSSGGSGGSAINGFNLSNPYPGGGGAAGRVRFIYNSANFSGVRISTAGGLGGQSNYGTGTSGMEGSTGTVSFGLFPSSPSALAVTAIYKSSAAYTWTGKTGAQWGGPVSGLPAALTIKEFRLYASTTALPFSAYYTGFHPAENASTLTETGLTPDSNIGRMLTAFTDYGDSAPSAPIAFITQAASPVGQGFPSASTGSVTFQWTAGSAAEGFNPAYTAYEINRSIVSDFSIAVSTALTVGLSSAPAGLAPNTTYYFRAHALGLNTAYTGFTAVFSTPTLALAPESPAFDGVFISSVVFSWSGAGNPPGTTYEAQLSQDGFLINTSSFTLLSSVAFTSLSPGNIYSMRVRAINYAGRQTAFTLTVSTTAGVGNKEAPGRPEPPNPTAAFSYDGTALFVWAPPAGSVPIFTYFLDVGTTPGGNDFLAASSAAATGPLVYGVSGLASGKTYYARVRAMSTAGVLGEFSQPGSGVAVWAPQAQPPVAKPYNWPNPFNPRTGTTNIGFNLSAPARVTLTIYTLQGRRVREISASESSGGNKVWSWDGRNGEGRLVEPGGYLALIKKSYVSGSETQRFKIAVLY